MSIVYARPEYISTLERSTAIAAHVKVDFELRGCPINKNQLVEVINAFLHGRAPTVPPHSVCLDCKRKGIVCVMVARGIPCMGPVTHTGCGVLCPSYVRGCYGCFGPKENPNTESLSEWFIKLGSTHADVIRSFRNFNSDSPAFRAESERQEKFI
jgi:coenzyme F420-reducing hydrogenase gamma subunit